MIPSLFEDLLQSFPPSRVIRAPSAGCWLLQLSLQNFMIEVELIYKASLLKEGRGAEAVLGS